MQCLRSFAGVTPIVLDSPSSRRLPFTRTKAVTIAYNTKSTASPPFLSASSSPVRYASLRTRSSSSDTQEQAFSNISTSLTERGISVLPRSPSSTSSNSEVSKQRRYLFVKGTHALFVCQHRVHYCMHLVRCVYDPLIDKKTKGRPCKYALLSF